MSRTKCILLAGIIALVGVSQVNAQGFGIGARYSYVTNIETEANSDMIGAMARLRGPVLGVEGAIDYRNDDLGNSVEQKTWPVTASLMVYPVSAVYGLAGVGWYNSTIDFPQGSLFEDQTSTEIGYHVGAGAELPLSPMLRATGDVRWQFVNYEWDEIPSSIGEDNADTWSLNAGLLFYLR